jgi:hypothetical protein
MVAGRVALLVPATKSPHTGPGHDDRSNPACVCRCPRQPRLPCRRGDLRADAPKAKPEQLAAKRRSRTHDRHPTGPDLTREIALYAEELKRIEVIKGGSETGRLAAGVAADGLAL